MIRNYHIAHEVLLSIVSGKKRRVAQAGAMPGCVHRLSFSTGIMGLNDYPGGCKTARGSDYPGRTDRLIRSMYNIHNEPPMIRVCTLDFYKREANCPMFLQESILSACTAHPHASMSAKLNEWQFKWRSRFSAVGLL